MTNGLLSWSNTANVWIGCTGKYLNPNPICGQFAYVRPMTEDPARREDRKGRAKILAQCVSDTVASISQIPGSNPISFSPNSGFLLANCYFLISDAYKIRRGMQTSRTHIYKVAAFVTATIMAVRPIRLGNTSNIVQIRYAQANQECAMRAAEALLGFDLAVLDADFLRRMYSSVFELVDLPCLHTYLADFDRNFGSSPRVGFADIEAAMPFESYGNIRVSPTELKILEMLVNQYTTLEKAHGNPPVRLMLRWWK
jgi:hypothetical protein